MLLKHRKCFLSNDKSVKIAPKYFKTVVMLCIHKNIKKRTKFSSPVWIGNVHKGFPRKTIILYIHFFFKKPYHIILPLFLKKLSSLNVIKNQTVDLIALKENQKFKSLYFPCIILKIASVSRKLLTAEPTKIEIIQKKVHCD